VNVPQAEHVRIDLDPAAVLIAFAGHRRRFAAEVAGLDADALAAPSRCTEWSNADNLRHLIDVDGWMRALWSGKPPPFTSFDPNTTPHEFVVAARSTPDEAIRDRYIASSEEMAIDLEATTPERWGQPSISPLGFVPWWLSALHIFWDSWLHERDVFLPMGITPPVVRDELVPVFTYAVALAGRMLGDDADVDVGGVRLVASKASPVDAAILPGASVIVTPVDPTPDPASVDAMAGRGDAVLDDQVLGLARLFSGAR
jgi:uncharacterized protein (TIGR03083 family)